MASIKDQTMIELLLDMLVTEVQVAGDSQFDDMPETKYRYELALKTQAFVKSKIQGFNK